MEVKQGYKQTEVGVIPEDWTVKEISDVAPLQRGFDLPTSQIVRGNYPVVYSNGVLNFHSKAMAKGPGVVTGRSGTIGKVNFVETDYWPHNTSLWVTDFKGNNPKYIYYLYTSIGLERFGTGSGVPTLNRNDVHAFKVSVPPLTEQHTIAAALGDVDALIRGLDELIAKKRDLKQAAMQDLLTGKRRLPGFSGEWNHVNLGDIFTFKNGLNKEKGYFGFGTPIVNYMDVYKYSGFTLKDIKGRVTVSIQELKNFEVRKGDVFFTRTSETVEEIGISAVMLDEPKDTVFSGFVLRARPKDNSILNEFKQYCFSSNSIRTQIVSKATYTTRALISGRTLSSVILTFPKRNEQHAIATILSDMDAEVAALEQQRDKTYALKQGMMQELLTGKTRLV